MDEIIRRLKEALEKMTPGPWEAGKPIKCDCGESNHCWHTFDEQTDIFPPLGEAGPVAIAAEKEFQNAAGIVTLRNLVPALLATLDAERKEKAELEGALQGLYDEWVMPGICPDCNHRWCKGKRDAMAEAERVLAKGHDSQLPLSAKEKQILAEGDFE